MLPDNPLKAIALAVSATVLFGTSDTISKYLSGSVPIVEFLWMRYVLFMAVSAILVYRARRFAPCGRGTRGFRSRAACASPDRLSCSFMACGK